MVRHLFELFTRNQTRGISHRKLSTGMCACQRVIQNALGSIWRRFGVDLYHPSPPVKKKKPGSTNEQHRKISQMITLPDINLAWQNLPSLKIQELTFFFGGTSHHQLFNSHASLYKSMKKSLWICVFSLQLYPSTDDSGYREVIHHLSDSGEEILYKQASDLRTADVHEILRAFVKLQ